jgi:hypothetical protein
MTSLPVSIPTGFSVVVKKGDKIEKGDTLAKSPEGSSSAKAETTINLTAIFNDTPDTVRKFLLKGPGDHVSRDEVIAIRSRSMGLKRDRVISHMTGTITRFDRGEGILIIQRDDVKPQEEEVEDILSPLAGTIKVCNNDSIVIEADVDEEEAEEEIKTPPFPKVKAENSGSGGKVTGTVMVLTPSGSDAVIMGTQITKDTIGKILLLPDIDKEAVAKASAIGVLGIIGTQLSKDLFDYVKERKIDIPLITIDQEEGKKLVKSKKAITINGRDRSIDLDEK